MDEIGGGEGWGYKETAELETSLSQSRCSPLSPSLSSQELSMKIRPKFSGKLKDLFRDTICTVVLLWKFLWFMYYFVSLRPLHSITYPRGTDKEIRQLRRCRGRSNHNQSPTATYYTVHLPFLTLEPEASSHDIICYGKDLFLPRQYWQGKTYRLEKVKHLNPDLEALLTNVVFYSCIIPGFEKLKYETKTTETLKDEVFAITVEGGPRK